MARVDNRHYSPQEIEEVKRLNRLEEVIAEYGIELRPEGPRLKGLCPFHHDVKRPNLTVYPDDQSWCCFACVPRIGGDVISFVKRREHVEFPEAFEKLRARRPGDAGASSPSGSRLASSSGNSSPSAKDPSAQDSAKGSTARTRKQWDRLNLGEQMVMNAARVVYKHALWRNARALAYVRERGIPDWLIRQSGLGYADGHSLELFLRRHRGLQIAEHLGLLRRCSTGERSGGHRELLGGRIVVPELRGGQCIWFIGRVLRTGPADGEFSKDRDGPPKYVALPGERPVLGFEQVAGRREAFVCEGVFDYLTALAWKLPACSFCGTSLPDDKLGFLASARAVYGLFDPDAAGQAAASRAADQIGPRFRAIALPDGCDLNELGCRPDGRDIFYQLLASTRSERHEDAEPDQSGLPRLPEQEDQQCA